MESIAAVSVPISEASGPSSAPLGPQPETATRREERTAAIVVEAGDDWTARWEGDAFVYEGRKLSVRSPWLGLRGRHQVQNAGAACAALEAIGESRITPQQMSAGLREVVWPARQQRLKPGPLAGDGAVWVDAAHNPGGAASLAQFEIPTATLESPHFADAILWVYVHMIVIGLITIVVGLFGTEARLRQWFARLMVGAHALYLFMDLRTSDSALGNGLYQGPASIVPAIIGLCVLLLFVHPSVCDE